MNRSLKPPRLWIQIVTSRDGFSSHIRKWSHAPFEGGVEYHLSSASQHKD